MSKLNFLCWLCDRIWCFLEKFTPLAKILHCRRQWREWQIPPLESAHLAHLLGPIWSFFSLPREPQIYNLHNSLTTIWRVWKMEVSIKNSPLSPSVPSELSLSMPPPPNWPSLSTNKMLFHCYRIYFSSSVTKRRPSLKFLFKIYMQVSGLEPTTFGYPGVDLSHNSVNHVNSLNHVNSVSSGA